MDVSFLNRLPGRDRNFLFQIRLNDGFVVLHGTENEAADQVLKGKVVLRLSKALRVKAIQLRMTAGLRGTWREEIRTTYEQVARNVDSTTEVFSHQLALLGRERAELGALPKSIVLNPGITIGLSRSASLVALQKVLAGLTRHLSHMK
ncbi:hypothetical protein BKA63DRAFT_325269 [Paraphoma chrysanthemicola]|nr:hypothetical protein BKA63DRAFT_325269 [Paraphoma chrysanthemicola]